MFTSQDKITLDKIFEKLNSKGDSLGKKINSNGSKVIRIVLISLIVVTIGALFFIATLLRSSFSKKNTH